MKNRTYRQHTRAIKEVRPGVWRGRISGTKGHPDVPPFEIHGKDAAFRWLRAGPDKLLPPCRLPENIRRQILERQKDMCRKISRRGRSGRSAKTHKAEAEPVLRKIPVYVAVIEHMSGTDVMTSLEETDLVSQLAAYCRGRWHTCASAADEPPAADQECVDLYFVDHQDDSYQTFGSVVTSRIAL